jgi:hypothetical protein
MPRKMAKLAPRPPFGLPEVRVAVCTSRRSCGKAGRAQIFTAVRKPSGESQFEPLRERVENINMRRALAEPQAVKRSSPDGCRYH